MILRVAFFCKHFGERGTERTTYDYADFNENLLGNKSYIICFDESFINSQGFISTKEFVKKKYYDRFEVFEIKDIKEINNILIANDITHFYTQSHGFHRDIFKFENSKIWNDCKTTYHCAFGPMVRQGSTNRCIVGSYLNNRFNKNLPVLPPIVRPFIYKGNLRSQLNIPEKSIVIGRHGGKETFDINFVKKAIINCINYDENIYFIFLNTEKFFEHKRLIHFNNFNDDEVLKFIGTCDAMIHARIDGETFGLSVAEFSAANKPIITFKGSKDKEHLNILKDKAILYTNEKDLISIFRTIKSIIKKREYWNAYKNYEPEFIMQIFKKICLDSNNKSFSRGAIVFLKDLPWEILTFVKVILNLIRNLLSKIMPNFLKRKFKILKKFLQFK